MGWVARRLRWSVLLPTFLVLSAWGYVLHDPVPPPPRYRAAREPMGPPAPPPPVVARLQVPDDAARLALADLFARDKQGRWIIPPHLRCYIRYLWIPDGEEPSAQVVSKVLAEISRGDEIVRPAVVAGGHLARVDLRAYAPGIKDYLEFSATWEELRFDPAFSLLITKDTIRFANLRQCYELPPQFTRKTITVNVPGGKPITRVVDTPIPPTDVLDVVKLVPDHLDPAAFDLLRATTRSDAPIVHHRYFAARALSQIQDDDPDVKRRGQDNGGLYKTVFGGLYYRFRGIRRAKDVFGPKTKVKDIDLFFQDIGIGNIKAGVDVEKFFDQMPSDQAAAMTRSDITSGPREILMFNVSAAKPTELAAFGSITGDVQSKSVDVGQRAFLNLLKPFRDGREAIFPTRINLVRTAFNGAGDLVDEVPNVIANDRTIPNPHPPRLEAAISCIRCHEGEGSDGWKPFRNDVAKRVANQRYPMDILTDLAGLKQFHGDNFAVNSRLVGKYGARTEKLNNALLMPRLTYAAQTLRATGPWKGGDGTQTDVVRLFAQRLEKEFKEYKYDLVTPVVALRELGLDVPDREARNPPPGPWVDGKPVRLPVMVFNALLPPDVPHAVVGDAVLEDGRITMLQDGTGIDRKDWALVYGFAMARAQRTIHAAGGIDKFLAKFREN